MAKTSFATQDETFVPFVPTNGYHVYGKLSLKRSLNDPDNTEKAKKLLRVTEQLTRGAEHAAKISGGELLEAQGELVHVLLPADEPDSRKLLTFAAALNDAVNRSVRHAAGDEFLGFSQASCWGAAVIVRSESFGILSEVSLGDAANQPAKRLYAVPGVPSGHLAIPESDPLARHLKKENGWANLPVNRDSLTNLIDERQYQELSEGFTKQGSVSEFDFEQKTFQPGQLSPSGAPSHVFGFCLRADMDGFSSLVSDSWKDGTIEDLVTQFYSVMRDANTFVQTSRYPIIPIPWAGDCATLVIPHENVQAYRDARQKQPVIATLEWNRSVVPKKYPKFSDVKWAVGIAGGDIGNRSFGNIITAELQGIRRTFPVAVGRGATWSHEAEQAHGLDGDETAIFYPEDHRELDKGLRDCFSEFKNSQGDVHSYFRKARNGTLQDASAKLEKELTSKLGSVTVSTTSYGEVPKPKPHFDG